MGAEASKTETITTSNNQRAVWLWKSNKNPWSLTEKEEWKYYSDIENEYIESAYRRNETEVDLNHYTINFKRKLQTNKLDETKQRPVKREEIDVKNYLREERFSLPNKLVKSFASDKGYGNALLIKWREKNEELIGLMMDENFHNIVKVAAKGILKEGKLLNREFDAQRIVEQLLSHEYQTDILKCVLRIYSMESFLYKIINAALRNEDTTKIDTLGPYCWLLNRALLDNKKAKLVHRLSLDNSQVVYRGTTLMTT